MPPYASLGLERTLNFFAHSQHLLLFLVFKLCFPPRVLTSSVVARLFHEKVCDRNNHFCQSSNLKEKNISYSYYIHILTLSFLMLSCDNKFNSRYWSFITKRTRVIHHSVDSFYNALFGYLNLISRLCRGFERYYIIIWRVGTSSSIDSEGLCDVKFSRYVVNIWFVTSICILQSLLLMIDMIYLPFCAFADCHRSRL